VFSPNRGTETGASPRHRSEQVLEVVITIVRVDNEANTLWAARRGPLFEEPRRPSTARLPPSLRRDASFATQGRLSACRRFEELALLPPDRTARPARRESAALAP